MKFLVKLSLLSYAGVSLAFPIDIKGRSLSLLEVREPDLFSAKNYVARANNNAKGSATAKVAGGATGGKAPTAAAVQKAASNFAKDANTVSASLNQLGTETNTANIKSLASTAFDAESDEDAQRAVLSAAAGADGEASNAKIVKNTPVVLDGLSAIMKDPSAASVKSNVQDIETARNPQILPSITQLSNAALANMGVDATQQKFPATTGSKQLAAGGSGAAGGDKAAGTKATGAKAAGGNATKGAGVGDNSATTKATGAKAGGNGNAEADDNGAATKATGAKAANGGSVAKGGNVNTAKGGNNN